MREMLQIHTELLTRGDAAVLPDIHQIRVGVTHFTGPLHSNSILWL